MENLERERDIMKLTEIDEEDEDEDEDDYLLFGINDG